MLAMLRKDCYVMGKYAAGIIITWIVMAGMYAWISKVESSFLYYFMPALSITIVRNAVSYDHERRWDRFAAMTPLRPWALVLEKYLLAYGALALMAGLGALAGWISTLGKSGANMWMPVVLALLMTATDLPVVYRFGRQRGAIILMVSWGLVAAAILGTAHWNYALIKLVFGWMEDVPFLALLAGIGGMLLVVNAGSILLSIRFYARRQRGWYD